MGAGSTDKEREAAVDHLCRQDVAVSLGCCPDVQQYQYPGQVLWPINLGSPSFQPFLQVAVDPFHHAVALGVVGGVGDVLDPQPLAGGGPDAGCELAATV